MNLVSEVLAEVADSKAEAEDNTVEKVDAAKEEDMMAVVDVEVDMEEAVGTTQLAGGADQIKEWCSAVMAHR